MASDTRAWEALLARVKKLNRWELKVGIIRDRQVDGANITLAELGAIHEYGAPGANIPARSWLRFTLDNRQREISKLLERGARQIAAGTTDALAVLATAGTFVSTAMKRSIAQRFIRQQLAESTIKRRQAKGQSDPAALLDTGALYDGIGYKIDKR